MGGVQAGLVPVPLYFPVLQMSLPPPGGAVELTGAPLARPVVYQGEQLARLVGVHHPEVAGGGRGVGSEGVTVALDDDGLVRLGPAVAVAAVDDRFRGQEDRDRIAPVPQVGELVVHQARQKALTA